MGGAHGRWLTTFGKADGFAKVTDRREGTGLFAEVTDRRESTGLFAPLTAPLRQVINFLAHGANTSM